MNSNKEERSYQELQEHCEELEKRMAALIELFETALEKDEKLHTDNEKLIQLLYERSQEIENLLNRMDELRASYMDLLSQHQKSEQEIYRLRKVLMESKGFVNEDEMEEWIEEFFSKPMINNYQA